MTQQHQQNHATWECKYHVVFIPKYRKKAIFGVIKKRLGDVFHELARRRESKIEEGHQRKEFDLDRAERRAQGAQFHRAQVLGSRLLRLDGRAGRGDDQSLHQEPRDAGSRTGSALNDPIVPSQK
jgi:hypothetical protein